MKLTLMIEGSAAVIASVLAALPDGATVTPTFGRNDGALPPEPSVTMPVGAVMQPGAAMTMPTSTDDEDDDDDAGAPATGEVDAEGIRWDERIHSGGKAQTTKGVWKKRKGVDAALVAQVEAEQRGGGAPAMPAAMPMPTAQPVPAMTMPTMAPVGGGGMPGVAPAAPTFPEFMQTLSGQMTAGKITTEQVQWVASTLGLNAITDLGVNPDKVQQAIDLFKQNGLWVA